MYTWKIGLDDWNQPNSPVDRNDLSQGMRYKKKHKSFFYKKSIGNSSPVKYSAIEWICVIYVQCPCLSLSPMYIYVSRT